MSITLGITPYSDEQTAHWLLQNLNAGISAQADMTTWYFDNNYEPENFLLLTYTRPEHALLNALVSGESPSSALDCWTNAAKALLKCFKANRKNAILLELSAVAHSPQAALTQLSNIGTLNATIENQPVPQSQVKLSEQSAPSAIYQLIANSLTLENNSLQQLLIQLEACTVPLVNDLHCQIRSQDFDQLADWVRQTIKIEQQRNGLEEETQLLQAQLHITQEELEQLQEKNKELEQLSTKTAQQLHQEQSAHKQTAAVKATLQAQFDSLQERFTELQKTEQQRSHLEEENQLLLEQLHLVQEELEQRFYKTQQQTQETETLQRRLYKLHSKFAALQSHINETKHQHDSDQSQTSSPSVQAHKITDASILDDLVTEVERSGLFNSDWYLTTYQDVALAKINPIEHYLSVGASENRNPSPHFDTHWYLNHYKDINDTGLNPLIHYIRIGHSEQRATGSGAPESLPVSRERA